MKNCITCNKLFEPTPRCKHIHCSPKCRNHNPQKSERTKKFQQARRQFLNEYKLNLGCSVCGYREHAAALHFNHVSGIKKFNLSQDAKRKLSDILKEMTKCEILCANCHAIHTFENKHFHTKRKDYNAG